MVLRLVTGKYKGKLLSSSDKAKELRPTQALVREAIINTFNSLFLAENLGPYSDFSGLEILDLYSGTGSMGFEFLSNGAKKVNFVDYDPKCIKLLESNTRAMNFEAKVKIYQGQLPQILKKINSQGVDLVFFDPPFKFSTEKYMEIFKAVYESGFIKAQTIFLLEYKTAELETLLLSEFSGGLQVLKTKNYGNCHLIYAQKKQSHD